MVQMINVETSNAYDRVQLVVIRKYLNYYMVAQVYHFSENGGINNINEPLMRTRNFYDIKSYTQEDGSRALLTAYGSKFKVEWLAESQ